MYISTLSISLHPLTLSLSLYLSPSISTLSLSLHPLSLYISSQPSLLFYTLSARSPLFPFLFFSLYSDSIGPLTVYRVVWRSGTEKHVTGTVKRDLLFLMYSSTPLCRFFAYRPFTRPPTLATVAVFRARAEICDPCGPRRTCGCHVLLHTSLSDK